MTDFTQVVKDYKNGELDHQISMKIAEVVKAVLETGKSGKVVLTLKVIPNGQGSVEIEAETKKDVPEPKLGKALFFATDKGDLSRRDPRQVDLPLREVGSSVSYMK